MRKRPAFVISGTSVAPGSRNTVHIPVSTLSDHTPVTLSAHVIHGRLDGSHVQVKESCRILKSPLTSGLFYFMVAKRILEALVYFLTNEITNVH